MIVRQTDSGFEIVYQSAHAHFASQLAALWQEILPNLDWPQLTLATLHHDHGWIPNDISGDLHDGKPRNFLNIDLDRAVHICQGSVDTAFSISSVCGILVARHMEYLYGGKPHRELQRSARSWKQRRARAMKNLGLNESWLEEHYNMILWADTVSLMICCEASGFTRALASGLQDQTFERLSDTEFTLSPWPFPVQAYQMSYEYHTLKTPNFRQESELKEALRRSVGLTRSLVFRSGDS